MTDLTGSVFPSNAYNHILTANRKFFGIVRPNKILSPKNWSKYVYPHCVKWCQHNAKKGKVVVSKSKGFNIGQGLGGEGMGGAEVKQK